MSARAAMAALGIAFAIAGTTLAAEPLSLESCEREIAASPADFGAYRCLDRLSHRPGGRDAALEFLEGRIVERPGDTHARTMLARLLSPLDPRVPDLLDGAIRDYTRLSDTNTLGWAHIYRSRIRMVRSELDDADSDAENAVRLARKTDDFPLVAMSLFQQSRIAKLRGDDGRLYGTLRALALDEGFETLSEVFRAAVLQNLGSVCGELNLHETALGYLRQAERLAVEAERNDWLFDTRYSMSSVAMRLERIGRADRAEALEWARAALAVAPDAWRRGQAEQRIAELTPGEEGLSMLRGLAQGPGAGFELWTSLGLRLLTAGPDRVAESIEPLERALAAAQDGPVARDVVRALSNLGRARLELGPREEGVEAALRAMDAVEGLHAIQTGEMIGARNFSIYSQIYYATVGKLLDGGEAVPYEDLELAFRVGERLRSRSLVESIEADPAGASAERREVLEKISALQLQIVLSEASPDERRDKQRELELLEEREALLRAPASREPVEAVSLEAIQRELRGDEALLSFLLSTPGSGGSWLFVATSTDARVHSLPPRERVETAVGFWLGLLQRGDGSERAPAAGLYGDLLADAIEALPPGVGRLIVVPDGALHRLPFDALRASADEPPLLRTFEVTRAPSAGIWRRLRRESGPGGGAGALILADPEPPWVAGDPSSLRAFRLAESVGPLPYARREARQAVRALGAGEVKLGVEASEAFVKAAALADYSVLHFAAHALIDDEHPERSAILLVPGDTREDGLLQAREVPDLDLSGTLVTLSACRSADGTVLPGEGVLGLARSFFQAHASVVVAGLWPLRDRATARLMASFYRGLGEGLPAGAAMTRAKRELERDGVPAAAWAGLVVIGNGERVPWQGGAAARPRHPRWLFAAAAAVLLLVAAGWLRRRRREGFEPSKP